MNKSIYKTVAVLAMPILLTACLGKGSKPADIELEPAPTPAPAPATLQMIDTLNFEIPNQLGMKVIKQKQSPQGSLFMQWNVGDLDDNASPVRIIYQRISPATSAEKLRAQLLAPYTQNCSDIKNTNFSLQSKYQPQSAVETICAKYGVADYGSLSQVVIFSDAAANHLLFTEVKTPPASKAGVLEFKDEQQKQQVQHSMVLIKVMYDLVQGVRICDAQKTCL